MEKHNELEKLEKSIRRYRKILAGKASPRLKALALRSMENLTYQYISLILNA